MEFRSQPSKSFDVVIGRLSGDGEEIDIGGFAADPVLLSYDKAAQATEFDRAVEKFIQVSEEGPPRFDWH